MKEKIVIRDALGNSSKEYDLIELHEEYVKVADEEIGGVFTFPRKLVVEKENINEKK